MNAPATVKKRSVFLKILIALFVLIIGFVIVVATRPAEYSVTRSASMAAPASVIFPHMNDLQKWQAWSPWAKLDPAAKYTFEGPTAGKGAIYRWVGNNQVGEGQMTITESRPNELVRFNLEFFKPIAGTSLTEFTFKPEGAGTVVTWTMSGRNNFIAKAMCLFMNMDKMIGDSFEQGLAAIKAIVEKPGQARP